MTKPTDIRIVEATCDFEAVAFRTPLKFGGRVTENTTLINVEVTVENNAGDYATGFGSMPLGNIWAWPSGSVSPDAAETAMSEFAEELLMLHSNPGHSRIHPHPRPSALPCPLSSLAPVIRRGVVLPRVA